MAEIKITREVIHIISRFSNWSAEGIEQSFRSERIYASRPAWVMFLHYFLLTAGVSFTVAGIIFFFAYNWDELSAFTRFGILLLLIISGISVVLFSGFRLLIRQIILTGTAIVTGALFAVYGQAYPTIADPSQLFLLWTIFTVLYAVASAFTPLWLLLFILANTTLILHTGENRHHWSDVEIHNLLFLVNLFFFVLLEWLSIKKYFNRKPTWLLAALMLFTTVMMTASLIAGIYDHRDTAFVIAILFSVIYYPLMIWYGYKNRKIFYIATTTFSLVLVAAALMIKPFDDPVSIFLVVSIFILLSTTLLIRQLIRLKRNWHE